MPNSEMGSKRLTVLLAVALSLAGCDSKSSLTYNVSVVNHAQAPLQDVEVQYGDGSWGFVFGGLRVGKEKSFSGINGMPPIPHQMTISWRDESGSPISIMATVPENVRERESSAQGDLQVVIESLDSVTIHFTE